MSWGDENKGKYNSGSSSSSGYGVGDFFTDAYKAGLSLGTGGAATGFLFGSGSGEEKPPSVGNFNDVSSGISGAFRTGMGNLNDRLEPYRGLLTQPDHTATAEDDLLNFYKQQWAEEYDADGIANRVADFDDDIAYYQDKIANAGGTAQADYDSAMSTLAQNYAIYERLLGATADDTREDILALIDEAGQADDLAMLDGDFGADYVTRGDIGYGVAGMNINPAGNYVSGDAAAALAAGTREAEMNRADFAARQAEENALIRSLSEMAGITANARMNDALQMRRDEEATLADRLRKQQAAAAERRAELQRQLDREIRDRDRYVEENGGTLDDYIAGRMKDWETNREEERLGQQLSDAKASQLFYDTMRLPTVMADPVLMGDLVRSTDALAVADRIARNGGDINGFSGTSLSDQDLVRWLLLNEGRAN